MGDNSQTLSSYHDKLACKLSKNGIDQRLLAWYEEGYPQYQWNFWLNTEDEEKFQIRERELTKRKETNIIALKYPASLDRDLYLLNSLLKIDNISFFLLCFVPWYFYILKFFPAIII